jgi:hypothetical protein
MDDRMSLFLNVTEPILIGSNMFGDLAFIVKGRA